MKSEKGTTLIEVIMAMALLGIIGVTLLSGTATTSTARITAEERSAAKVLAETAMEAIKKQPFEDSYEYTPPPGFAGYTLEITVQNVMIGLQNVKVDIIRHGRVILSLESYKSDR